MAERPATYIDSITTDVAALYRRFPIEDRSARPILIQDRWYSRWYRRRWLPRREVLARLLRQSGLDQSPFEEFAIYWRRILGGRPLWGIEDFAQVRHAYRIRATGVTLPESPTNQAFVETWQHPSLIYQVLHGVYLEMSPRPLSTKFQEIGALRHLKRRPQAVLEFGCAVASLTRLMLDFTFPRRDVQITISDLATMAFHFAATRFRGVATVRPVLLRPEEGFLPAPEPQDAIFCMTVFEHVNQPLALAERFAKMLRPGGLLIFDYIKAEPGGLDSPAGAAEREAVLAFIGENFEIVEGDLDPAKTTRLTVARRSP